MLLAEPPFFPFLVVLLLLEEDFTAFLTSFSSLAIVRYRPFPEAFVTSGRTRSRRIETMSGGTRLML